MKFNYIQLSFLVSLIATAGSLYFGEVLKYPPCTLCWYQRICMYPLVVILGSALWNDESRFYRAALPLSAIGLLIAAYHNLLYYGIIPDSITPCSQGVSCTSKQVEIFGFLTIPLMSLISFILLTSLGFIAMKTTRRINEK
ncbi:MAG: disulfide bond formation protein B [Bdellovibrionaceae bacterium]|nr:disulfide bond formation protein B [Pseudobdellovibrionaceae bacterium]